AGRDVGGHLSIAAHCDTVAGQVDGALDLAVDIERLGPGDFSLDYEAFANGGLFAGGGRLGAWRGSAGGWLVAGRLRSRGAGRFIAGRLGRSSWLVGFPHFGFDSSLLGFARSGGLE